LPADESPGRTDRLAREVSWLRAMGLVALTIVSSPALVWTSHHTGRPTASMARIAATALVIMTMGDYLVHLVKYNSIVQKRMEALASLLPNRGSTADD